jgi:glucosamine--fructose-6-phosphate aminotransferase (isomerizing)
LQRNRQHDLARSGNVLYTYAGPEIAVAATKSYLTQIIVMYLCALDLAQKRGTMTAQQ